MMLMKASELLTATAITSAPTEPGFMALSCLSVSGVANHNIPINVDKNEIECDHMSYNLHNICAHTAVSLSGLLVQYRYR